MADEKEPKPDDLAVDDLDTVAGGTGHGAVEQAMSETCHGTITPERPL
jgi:hypothetical protein